MELSGACFLGTLLQESCSFPAGKRGGILCLTVIVLLLGELHCFKDVE